MPTARHGLGVGVVNGILYAVGGSYDLDQYQKQVEAYDPATDTWTTKAPIPTVRKWFGVGVVNGILYAVGGLGYGRELGTVEAYDPATDSWTTKASMPTPREGLTIEAVNGILYAVGGLNRGTLAIVEAYDPTTDTWTTKASMPTARAFLAAGLANGILYAIGGDARGIGTLATLDAYNPPPPPRECANPPPGSIWCDDFEVDRLGSYFEIGVPTEPNTFARTSGAGLDASYGMKAIYNPGAPDAGDLKLAFGKSPDTNYVRPVDAGTANFREIYWRAFVKDQAGWTGGGGNGFGSAMVLASPAWAQAAISHVWNEAASTDSDYLLLDPARGTDVDGNLVTTRYNDFVNLTWLRSARGATPIFDAAHVGQWYCIEVHMKLNDAGQENGTLELWVNATLEAQRAGLNFLGSYDTFGINAIFFKNFWDGAGPPATEARYWDNIIVGTRRIGCGVAPPR
jgi:hypothetical protein